MKVLHLNTYDTSGGAARAVYRLHQGLRNASVDSTVLVQDRQGDDSTVQGCASPLGKFFGRYLNPRLDTALLSVYRHRKETPFHIQWLPGSTIGKISSLNPDIVHLHWICDGFIRIENLSRINRPVVWTLHDSWPFTGGCHIPFDCTGYHDRCGCCTQLGSRRGNDLSRWTWLRKSRSFSCLCPTIVTPSRWLAECSRKSSLFRDTETSTIPNGLNVDLYKPLDRLASRAQLNLPQDRRLVLFGAVNAMTDMNKGFQYIQPALQYVTSTIRKKPDLELVVFGASEPPNFQHLGFKTHFLGRLHDEISMRVVYSACDVTVVPSIQENLSNVVMESMACGTPSVAFDVGGMPDMIDHEKNGYLAEPFVPADLGKGIDWVISDQERYQFLSRLSREKITRCFNVLATAGSYLELYQKILHRSLAGS